MTASAPLSAASSVAAVSIPGHASKPATKAGGPATRTRAPSVVRRWMFERATREWTTSPTIATVAPSSVPSASRRVSASRQRLRRMRMRPVTGVDDAHASLPRREPRGAGRGWRRTQTVTPVRSSVRSVSTSDSPLPTLLPAMARSTVVAPSAFAASSKLTRVRVDGS